MTTDNKPPKTKPCPFCNAPAFIYYNEVENKFFAGCSDHFGDCKVISSTRGYEDADVAADAWNRRGRIIIN